MCNSPNTVDTEFGSEYNFERRFEYYSDSDYDSGYESDLEDDYSSEFEYEPYLFINLLRELNQMISIRIGQRI